VVKNDGKEYEEFVRQIQQSLINAENRSGMSHIEITKNKKILDVFGIEREFDLY
jgi:DNA-directed RNA polymerase subunit N (RpoN/RPB10)